MSDRKLFNFTILVIEDSHYDYFLIKQVLLEKYPALEVLYASSLEHAYDIYKVHDYDLVIMDLNLPDGYGTGSVHEVKKFHGETPILAITGMQTTKIENNVLRMGASKLICKDYLLKPEFLNEVDLILTKLNENQPQRARAVR